MNPQSPGQRWLVMAAPALLVLVAYLAGSYRPQQAALAQARARLSSAGATAVTAEQLAARRQELREIEDRIDIAKRNLPGASTQPAIPNATVDDAALQTRAQARITEILGQRDAMVAAAMRLSENDAASAMPMGLSEALSRVVPAGGSRGVWRVDVIASFPDLRELLSAIAAEDGVVVPLGISMEPSQDGQSLHNWSLWIWM